MLFLNSKSDPGKLKVKNTTTLVWRTLRSLLLDGRKGELKSKTTGPKIKKLQY